jgi:hypothetical protein
MAPGKHDRPSKPMRNREPITAPLMGRTTKLERTTMADPVGMLSHLVLLTLRTPAQNR